MVSVEFITEKAMGIITYAGMAKSSYMEALGFAKQEKFSESDDKLKSIYCRVASYPCGSSAERDVLRRTSDQSSDGSCGGSADGCGNVETGNYGAD